MRSLFVAAFLSLGVAGIGPAAAQNQLERFCDEPEVQLLQARDACLAAAQATTSAQPAVGIAIAAGNPTIGTAGAAGLRLGVIPRASAGIRLNVAPVGLPDILVQQLPGQAGQLTRRFGAAVPALTADASLSLTQGFDVAPGLGGMGAISLLGSASVLPFRIAGIEGFDRNQPAIGLGARVHLLRESFVAPGVSASLMHRRLSTVQFGNICPQGFVVLGAGGSAPHRESGLCAGPGDIGQFSFDLVDWSSRIVASKRLLGIGATVGLGHDRYSSDIGFGFRSAQTAPGTDSAFAIRFSDLNLEASRWTVFGNASYTLIFGTIAAEAGWQQGTAPLTGFQNIGSEFDPRGGTWFGSIGARLAL
jgi:hypothetical protein